LAYTVTLIDRANRQAQIELSVKGASKFEDFYEFRGSRISLPIVRVPIGLPVYRMENFRTFSEQAAASRQDLSARALARARQAEELTLMREISRLAALGIQRQPKWIAIEDNTAGYDVLSFDPGEYEPKNRLIEVKSTVASPLRFFLTRNEWEKALKYGDSYHFHVWDMSPDEPRLYERTTAQIAPHIPKDQERGKWANAEIPLGATG
jgi:hypothetical protein